MSIDVDSSVIWRSYRNNASASLRIANKDNAFIPVVRSRCHHTTANTVARNVELVVIRGRSLAQVEGAWIVLNRYKGSQVS